MNFNIRSLRNKIVELETILDTENPHFLCISEHWLSTLEMVSVEGYSLISGFFRSSSCTGGVCLLARSDLTCKAIDVSEYAIEKHFECSSLIYHKLKIIILTV